MDSLLLFRHTLGTLAYRAARALHPAPADFAAFRPAPGSRTAGEILAHMGDLLDWAAGLLAGDSTWRELPPGQWEADKDRFFSALTRLDQALQRAGAGVQEKTVQRLFQGPIADALTHVGQIALLRGAAGAPVRGENYFVADIAAGRTTHIQPSPKRTF
jgi:hypothetical protein